MEDDRTGWPVVELAEVRAFVERCMVSAGAGRPQAADMAELLLSGDYRGHYSHGLNRVEMYAKQVQSGCIDGKGTPSIVKESIATAFVDGRSSLGPSVGRFCMDLAIKKAKTVGFGMVVAKGSTHYGIAGWYAMEACKHNLVGMSFTSTPAVVYATRGKERTLGTNPIAMAAPIDGKPEFVLDMATSTVANGKVRMAERKKQPIPHGWGSDHDGVETTNPREVLDDGGLLPLGGSEITGGYKGYGLGMMVEILCSVLAGSTMTYDMESWSATQVPQIRDVGQCFIAIDPSCFADGFDARMQNLLDVCRSKTPIDPQRPVLIPGDPEAINMKTCDELGGIPYHPNQIQHVNQLAERLNVECMKTL